MPAAQLLCNVSVLQAVVTEQDLRCGSNICCAAEARFGAGSRAGSSGNQRMQCATAKPAAAEQTRRHQSYMSIRFTFTQWMHQLCLKHGSHMMALQQSVQQEVACVGLALPSAC
jgi:hypothetical protein